MRRHYRLLYLLLDEDIDGAEGITPAVLEPELEPDDPVGEAIEPVEVAGMLPPSYVVVEK